MSTTEPLDGPISGKHQESGLEHCIERSYLVPVGEDIDTKAYEIDGQQGLIATIEDGGDSQYIVAYSPDQENGSGSIVCSGIEIALGDYRRALPFDQDRGWLEAKSCKNSGVFSVSM